MNYLNRLASKDELMDDLEKAPGETDGWSWFNAPPRTDDALMNFHYEASDGLRQKFVAFLDAVVAIFGERTAESMALSFLESTHNTNALERLSELGWREYLDDQAWTDWIELSQPIRDWACYGIEGAVFNGERQKLPREERVRKLNDAAVSLLACGAPLLPDQGVWALHFVRARFVFDFGGAFTLRDLQLLAQIGYPAVRNAAASGELILSKDGTVEHELGVQWLTRRRGFLPSRWRNPEDDQYPIAFVGQDGGDTTQVPQCEDGLFLPETTMRGNRKSGGMHVTIGAKGEEESVTDFFEALRKLARMPTPRWRRRNAAGNWGIVRARGAWVSVPTKLISKQLATMVSES
jgi:hypothetical protein